MAKSPRARNPAPLRESVRVSDITRPRVRTSVLIPSFGRPEALSLCLASLKCQSVLPDEVVVVWQERDEATLKAASQFKRDAPFAVVIAHSPQRGITCSENVALKVSRGDIVVLIDDDATAPSGWIERHLSHFEDNQVGAVGGPANNYTPANALFPRREPSKLGRVTWYGRCIGSMYDFPPRWKARPPIQVDHLVGYNMSIRRIAFDQFEERLRPYWQKFEMEVCLEIRRRGYQVVFDFANVVNHYPTNTVYAPGRSGNLQLKVYGAAYNWAFVLSKHSPRFIRFPRLVYLLLVGSASAPGLFGAAVNGFRSKSIVTEFGLLPGTISNFLSGWFAGKAARRANAVSSEA